MHLYMLHWEQPDIIHWTPTYNYLNQ